MTRPVTSTDAPRLTWRQFTVLTTMDGRGCLTQQRIGVRADVLWRMQERGWVAASSSKWWITKAGSEVLAAFTELYKEGKVQPK